MTTLPPPEIEERLKRNKFPCVVISDGSYDYTELCEQYKVCYIHSDVSIQERGINQETLPVLLNRICLSAAAIDAARIVYFVNCCDSFIIDKTIILEKVAANKENILGHFHKHQGNISLPTLVEFFKKL